MHVHLAELITSIDHDTSINNEAANTAIEIQKIIDLDGHGSIKNKS